MIVGQLVDFSAERFLSSEVSLLSIFGFGLAVFGGGLRAHLGGGLVENGGLKILSFTAAMVVILEVSLLIDSGGINVPSSDHMRNSGNFLGVRGVVVVSSLAEGSVRIHNTIIDNTGSVLYGGSSKDVVILSSVHLK